MKRILIAVCGIGDPNFDTKISACVNNIELIKKTAPTDSQLEFKMFAYDERLQSRLDILPSCSIIRENGFVGEFIFRHLQPSMVSVYDRIIVTLDDVILMPNVNIKEMLDIQDKYNYAIISPTHTVDSNIKFEIQRTRHEIDQPSVLTTSFAEFFFYVMNPRSKAYHDWLSCFDDETKSMWGIDMLLHKVFGMKIGLINHMHINHLYKGGSKMVHGGAELEMNRLFDRIREHHTLPRKFGFSYLPSLMKILETHTL